MLQNYANQVAPHLKGTPGSEVEDMTRIMKGYRNWGHKLFAAMTFDDVVERCERLGGKQEVQLLLDRLRWKVAHPEDFEDDNFIAPDNNIDANDVDDLFKAAGIDESEDHAAPVRAPVDYSVLSEEDLHSRIEMSRQRALQRKKEREQMLAEREAERELWAEVAESEQQQATATATATSEPLKLKIAAGDGDNSVIDDDDDDDDFADFDVDAIAQAHHAAAAAAAAAAQHQQA